MTPSSPRIDLQRMPFDQYGRYKIIAEVVDAFRTNIGVPRLRILDVGGYQIDERFGERLPLTLFLPADEIAALDTIPSSLPNYYQGDGTAMPFDDGAYDLVVSADTLEHIPPDKRRKFVRELARVSTYGVALIAPFFSNETELAEIVLARYMQAELRYKHPFLQEHRDYGLPRVPETEQWLQALGCATATFPSGYVHSWLEMMVLRTLLWRLTQDDALVGAVEEYYNRVLFPLERREPAYRHLIIAAPQDRTQLVDVARQTLAPTLRDANETPVAPEQFLQQFLLQLMPMGLLDRMRGEDEQTVAHWQDEAHQWHVEANRVEYERRKVEAQAQHWEREANRVELERQALEREREALRQQLDQQRRDLTAERDQWQQRAQRPILAHILDRVRKGPQ